MRAALYEQHQGSTVAYDVKHYDSNIENCRALIRVLAKMYENGSQELSVCCANDKRGGKTSHIHVAVRDDYQNLTGPQLRIWINCSVFQTRTAWLQVLTIVIYLQ